MDRWGNLNMQQKNQLLGIYASKGYTDLASIINHYNTFQAGGRLTFNEWKSQMQSKYPDIEMDNTKAGYDYVRYFNDNYDDAIRQLSELRHFPDTYKLPNHPTFSNESIYSRSPMMGGSWINDSTFSPSIINRQQYPNIYKEDRPYAEREIYGNKYQLGGKLGHITSYGQWQYPHQVTTIPSNNITMKGVDYPVIGVSDTGDTKYMLPNMDYLFDGNYVTEYPVHKFQDGGPDDDKYSFLRREPEVAVTDNTRYVRPISDVEIDRASGLPEGTTTMRRIISAQTDRQQPVIKQDNATNETHKSINKEVKKAQNAKKVNDAANVVAAITSIPATIVAPEVMTPIFALQGFNDATDILSKEGNLNTEDYSRLGLDALFMLPMFNTAGNYLRFNTNLGRSYELSRALNKSVRNTELSQRSIENPANNRFKLGDVEIDNPNLMYHVDNGDYTGFSGNGAYVKDGMLFPSQHSNGQKPYTWWNLGRPYRNGQTRLLTTTKDNPSLLRVRDQDYPIGQWTGNPKDRTFVTNQEYVSSEPVQVRNEYKLDPNYGYKRTQEPIPTLEQAYQEGMNTKVQGSSNSKVAPVLADALYKDASFDSDPLMQMLYTNYISGESTFGNMLPQKTIQTGLDDDAIQLLRNRTLNRNIQAIKEDPNLSSSFLGESRIKKLNEIFDKDLPSIKVGKYSGQDYKNAGRGNWGGFYNKESRFISINRDSGYPMKQTQAHEGLHHIASKHSLTTEQDAALSKAFDGDFNTLPETEYAPEYLKGYTNMRHERITTNRDARDELLGYEDMPLEKQNQIIDQATDDAIFSAVENANGYGQAYIKRLRAENKLTHEKANAFRESMKKVGAITGIIGTGAAATQK